MPKITIFEKDLTTASVGQVTANITYVPGYAIMGPVNKPTLCQNLSDFQSIFGYKPYMFREAQANPRFSYALSTTEKYAYVDDYEKSYIYATELLSRGLPILFERVQLNKNLNWKASKEISFLNEIGISDAKLILTAKDPGKYGSFIEYSVDQITDQELTEQINISLSKTSYSTNKEANAYTNVELTEGQISIPESTVLDVKEILENVLKILYQDNEYYINIADVDEIEERDDTKQAYLEVGTYITGGKINGEPIYNSKVIEIKTTLVDGDIINVGSKLAIGSKISGSSISKNYDNTVILGSLSKNLYSLNIKLTSDKEINGQTGNSYGIKENIIEGPIYISFDSSNANYYKNIKTTLIDIRTENYNSSLFALNIENKTGNLELNIQDTLTPNGTLKDEFYVSDIYTLMDGSDGESIFDKLADKGDYQVKNITSGSYPVFEYNNNVVTNKMLSVAALRGDALALIDHTNVPERKLVGKDANALYTSLQSLSEIPVLIGNKNEDARKYGAMFTAWGMYECKATGVTINTTLPASFAYLECLAISTQTNENWYAVAGVTRGLIPNLLSLTQNVTGAISQEMQGDEGISINPITMIKPYGYCIWGNRTLNKNKGLVASSFLNIRALTNDVKKVVYTAARKLTFELNNDILWLNFRSEIEPTLDRMVSGNGLRDYKIIRKASTKKATVEAIIRLYAIEAVEDWDITIELADNYVSVE